MAIHAEFVQPAPKHEGLAMQAPIHQVLHDFHEDSHPGQQTDRWVTKSKLATKIEIELRCASPAWLIEPSKVNKLVVVNINHPVDIVMAYLGSASTARTTVTVHDN